jgi:4-hydroxy-3-methylbut-2-enyl diphosphate reductase
VPEELVDEVLEALAARGFGDVELVQTAEEDVQFSLPAELRKTMKAAGEETTNKIKRH